MNFFLVQESEEIKSNSLDQKLKEKEIEFTQHLQEKNDHMEVITCVLYIYQSSLNMLTCLHCQEIQAGNHMNR